MQYREMDRKMRKSEEKVEKVKRTKMIYGSKREQTDGQVEIKGERGRGKQKERKNIVQIGKKKTRIQGEKEVRERESQRVENGLKKEGKEDNRIEKVEILKENNNKQRCRMS